ncbi:hypothetical protein [Aureimonas populi]|uniref:Lipoprotein n=1 Tax=Aureimonas populi TaxID=1701758 RepID=A0ABW5CMX1_9HYPH|nr:hypothetical protein [Aureimonas populi]
MRCGGWRGVLAIGAASVLSACAGAGAQVSPVPSLAPLTPAETAYVEQTAAVVYRRAAVERLSGLLFSDARGHGTCVRSPARQPGSADYTLLILQRRITEDFIPQAADDVLILRSREDAAPCRRLGVDPRLWVRAS